MEAIAAYFTTEHVMTLFAAATAAFVFGRLDRKGGWGRPVHDASEWRAVAAKHTQRFLFGLAALFLPLLFLASLAMASEREVAVWQYFWLAFLHILVAGVLIQTAIALRSIRKWKIRFSHNEVSYLTEQSGERRVRKIAEVESLEEHVFRPSRFHFADETITIPMDAAGYVGLWSQLTQEMARRA